MKTKSIIISCLLTMVTMLSAQAQTLTIDNVSAQAGGELELTVKASNVNSYIATGFYVELPNGFSAAGVTATKGSGLQSGHVVKSGTTSDTKLRVAIYSKKNSALSIPSSSSPLCTLKLKAPSKAGTYTGRITGVEFSNANHSLSAAATKTFTITVVNPSTPGDVNTITVNVSPSGSGSVTGGGTYASNSTVELRANANAGYTFSRWGNDNATPMTNLVNTNFEAWNAGGMVGWAAPEIITDDGQTVALAELYEETTETTGTVMEQTLTGLDNGSYSVTLYANAHYTPGRGFSTNIINGQMDVVYIFANSSKLYIPAHISEIVTEHGEYTLTTTVTNGTLRIGMVAEKPGTNWHSMQIKRLAKEFESSTLSSSLTANPINIMVTEDLSLTAYFNKTINRPGDVNSDQAVDVADVASIIDVMAGNSLQYKDRADVNGDRAVDVADIASVITVMAGGSITTGDDRQLVVSCDVDGTEYAVYIKQDWNDVCYNADHSAYFRTTITLDVTKNGKTTTYPVDNSPYIGSDYNSQIRSMCINKVTNQIFIFANSSLGYGYSLDGYCYVASLSNMNFQKETVFTEQNDGWWPYFSYDGGTLRLNHFSFGGYYTMTSTRNGDGTWSSEWGTYILPDDFKAQAEQAGRVLVVDGSNESHAPAGVEAVDLGLPSGTKWANMNIGAKNPSDIGNYYAWGETEVKSTYSWATYLYGNSNDDVTDIGADIGGTAYDVARTAWVGTWRIPSNAQWNELLENCDWEWTFLTSTDGVKLTSKKNGNSIFLPTTGFFGSQTLLAEHGYYWSSTLTGDMPRYAWVADFASSGVKMSDRWMVRYFGVPVRPVR